MHKKKHKKNIHHTEDVKNLKIFLVAVICVIVVIAFMPCLDNGFTDYDDDVYVYNNLLIRSLSLNNLKSIFTDFSVGNYLPLTILSHAIEYQFWELNPKGYHVVNLSLHVCNSILVFIFILLITKNTSISFLASLFFSIHPLRVETVAWIADRKDLLCTFFYLSSLIFYIKYKSLGRKNFFVLSIIFCILSLFSKGSAISLPFVLLLVDYFLGYKIDKKMFAEKIPFFTLAIIFGIIAIAARNVYAMELKEFRFSIFDKIFLNVHRLIFYYFLRNFLPINISLLLPNMDNQNPKLPSIFFIITSFISLFCLTVASILLLKKTKKIFFGFFFFLLTIIPVLNVVVLGYSADRFTYLPSIGIMFIIAEGFVFLLKKFENDNAKKNIIVVILAGIFFILGIQTWKRCHIWRDTITLMTDAIKNYPNEQQYYYNRANAYIKHGAYNNAISDYTKAISLDPKNFSALLNRGNAFIENKQYREAIDDFNMAINLEPKNPNAFINRGNAYHFLKDYNNAISDYTDAIYLDPKNAKAFFSRGNVYFKIGDIDKTISDMTIAIKLKPDYVEAYRNRLIAYYAKGETEKAEEDVKMLANLGYPLDAEFLELLRTNYSKK